MIRFVVFVDGSNLFGSLKKVGLHVDEYERFFRYILELAVESWRFSIIDATPSRPSVRLNRVLWYEVGTLDEWDLNDEKSILTLHEWFKSNAEVKRKYHALVATSPQDVAKEDILDQAWQLCLSEVRNWYTTKAVQLQRAKDFHFAVQASTDFIDIIPSGHLKVDILNRSVIEKGIDTSLAVDMVSLIDTYDVALLISGDADSIPSVERVKQRGKQVGVIEFIKGHPPEKKGRQSSSKLKAAADFVVPAYEFDLIRKGVASNRPQQ